MIGAIAGDVIGSVHEFRPIKTKEFTLFHPDCVFTDDTVMTLAVAQAILENRDYQECMQELGRRYPNAGYGGSFIHWVFSHDPQPYNSWGNGAAMRVSPVGFAFDTEEEVLAEAERSAEVSHNHPEGVKGAQATALAIFLARKGASKPEIKAEIQRRFAYDLERSLADIRPGYRFDVSCQGSVPEALIAFLESNSWEDAVRNAVSLGGDSDTQACIAGGIAQAHYGPIPSEAARKVEELLPPDLREIAQRFMQKY